MNDDSTPRLSYLLFGGTTYYACGGWLDLLGRYPDQLSAWTAAQEMMQSDVIEWWQIVDAVTGEMVSKSPNDAHC